MTALAHEMGVAEGISPFIALSFVSLPVIPQARITPRGVYDVDRQAFSFPFGPGRKIKNFSCKSCGNFRTNVSKSGGFFAREKPEKSERRKGKIKKTLSSRRSNAEILRKRKSIPAIEKMKKRKQIRAK